MGQSHSATTTTSTVQSNDSISSNSSSIQRRKSIQLVKQKLSRSELLALHNTFQHLKTQSTDHGDFIEPKRFLEQLQLPSDLETAGVLLFKSFSQLGAYPNYKLSTAPIHLSWNSFLTAFAVLTGKLDEPHQDSMIFETAFFESLAVLPRPDQYQHQPQQEKPSTTQMPNILETDKSPKGLTLADLGIQFDDADNDDVIGLNSSKESTQDTLKILQTDLTELFVLALWIVHAEHVEQQSTVPDIDSIRSLADTITKTILMMDRSNNYNNKSEDDCISHHAFCIWKDRNAPFLFKTIQSFIYTRFAMVAPIKLTDEEDTVSLRTMDLVLSQDIAPLPLHTDILDTNCCALLSWCLPETFLATKQWRRLYSGDKDGFSMNRFESHVFKYPGPTLLVIKVQVTNKNISKNDDDLDDTTMILAALINEPWKHGRQYWGSDACFLMELYPRYETFKPTGKNQQYVYCQQQFGIAFGGTTSHPPSSSSSSSSLSATQMTTKMGTINVASDGCILYLDNTLQNGRYHQEQYPALPTYQKSEQRSSGAFDYLFDVENVEVFGLGDEKLTLLQKKAWDFEYQDATRRAGVQIRQQDGQVDKEILKLAGIIQDDHHHYYETSQQQQQQQYHHS
ncbi:TLD-domain-containing protein [Halteromyces radiatus]|uniref:TLD-domain-containing protein n=1 Tax=Halteromyces radiatus TaxID=101107 RepID=UPI00221F84B4|nr:TLD-domain-containing protein [Halteromyces radiatus]KAI8100106.1 TLD-domain-containing protein [Halteromyces radiatus]